MIYAIVVCEPPLHKLIIFFLPLTIAHTIIVTKVVSLNFLFREMPLNVKE